MTNAGFRSTVMSLSCADVAELAGLYVLDALDPAEREAVSVHLATCPNAHDEIIELGGLVPALASSVEPIDAPAELKARVMAAVASAAADIDIRQAETRPTTTEVKPWALAGLPDAAPALARQRSLPAWASWGSTVAAVVVLAVVGAWGLGAQSAANQANERAQILGDAIAAYSSAGSSTAIVRGTGDKAGASGFAAFAADGRGYVVIVGLAAAPAGQTYQAWYIAEGGPRSAGLMTVDADGYAVMVDDHPLAGTQAVALTVEPAGGSDQPTTEPFAAGDVRPSA